MYVSLVLYCLFYFLMHTMAFSGVNLNDNILGTESQLDLKQQSSTLYRLAYSLAR